ncbi:exodeoxyribonuclease VII small subunit [Cyanobium sp. Morenito 9A2]|uniref:exodeoxyribonuclease VII small subunit n=1 Tax=Cyanobium sp. Morenito 9A2 TaxID=2823718 RepID=UPI0020CE0CEA|nr:exodeoxyribonuclease VII small subunit [Cyanobium sp. Morenito 9A2]MCP9849882.1 exodeoxyribonuclease VII small subunit [Cyanobium sp. Morenito 9A2]
MSASEPGQSKKGRGKGAPTQAASTSSNAADADWSDVIASLSYQQARTAMDLAIAQLQAEDLEVEQMVDLYRRALAYAERCEQVLDGVEQVVLHLDPSTLTVIPSDSTTP